MTEQSSNILTYQDTDGNASLQVKLDQETVWLTQEQMSLLFGRERSVMTKHSGGRRSPHRSTAGASLP